MTPSEDSRHGRSDRGVAGRRKAFVTGASAGLGRAIAIALARDGFDLALSDLDPDWLNDVLRHPDVQARKVIPIALDLRSEDSIWRAVDGITAALGGLDILVNNAGCTLHKPATEVTWSEWDDVLDVNLKGSFFLATRCGRYWLEGGRAGAIINVASTHGLVGLPDRSVYGISKAGLIQMTRMLAIEWAARNIRVNAIAPGTVLTPSRAEMLRDPEARQRMLGRIPTGRFPTPEEVAAAVRYLASPEAAAITGHTLVVDGGLTAY